MALANKEQRGYITPQEYNLLANQAQLLIFDEYFYEIDKRLDEHGNSTEYSDMLDITSEKLSPFLNTNVDMATVSGATMTLPTTPILHKLGTVFYNDGTRNVKVERIDANQAELMGQHFNFFHQPPRLLTHPQLLTVILLLDQRKLFGDTLL